jgi:hypothetical protein
MGQVHCCQCGFARIGKGKCEVCDSICFPEWQVIDSKGRIRGYVIGFSFSDALFSARESIEFDHLKSFTVREHVRSAIINQLAY